MKSTSAPEAPMFNGQTSNVAPSIVVTPTDRIPEPLPASEAPSEETLPPLASFEDPSSSGGDAEKATKKKRPKERLSCWQRTVRVAKKAFHLVKSEVGLVILLIIYSLIGAAVFMVIEGRAEDRAIAAAEDSEKTESNKVRRNFRDAILNLTHCSDRRNNYMLNESDVADDVANDVDRFLRNYEIMRVYESQVDWNESSQPRQREWTYFRSLFFCGTVYTTVGYGNIVPMTSVGRIVTMFYAVFGIPLCLVVLSKLGKSLTRAIKFLWSFVRRFYYTGSCMRMRRNKGWRKLSPGERLRLRLRKSGRNRKQQEMADIYVPYDVDDNFNLPPIVAILIAFLYIFLGALMYTRWEDWTYLEAFYFTFTSLATIGFGDILPSHPKFFLAASAYILIGLSLIAMVINVIMEAVSETIVKATDRVKQQIIRASQFEGLTLSPLYRQGLVLRPFFFRQPSTLQQGSDQPVDLLANDDKTALPPFRRHSI